MIGRHPVHALCCTGNATKDIAAADDERELRPGLDAIDDILGDSANSWEIDAVRPIAHEGFTRYFKKHPLVTKIAHDFCFRLSGS
jgi:hypothetical protein